MVRAEMIKKYAGLSVEKTKAGTTIYRVRPRRQHGRKIQIHGEPGTEAFDTAYWLARSGKKLEKVKLLSEQQMPKTIGWLVHSYFEHFEKQIAAKSKSAKTLKKKRNLLARLIVNPNKEMLIPREKLVEMQDKMAASPAQADAFIEAVRVLYDWAIERGHVKSNPARGIRKIYRKGTGAKPWNSVDFERYFSVHKPGTPAHVSLTVLLCTGCRVEDLTILGRQHECKVDGVDAIRWQPLKKGSSEVCLPLLDQLRDATRAPTVQGQVYVLSRRGKPYASGDAMSAMFKRWCAEAGMPDKSAHGVRKWLAETLAADGSQYSVMAVLGHSEAKTSEVYTRRVDRSKLSFAAMARFVGKGE